MKVKIFTTGGTIDGLEYDSEEKAPKAHETLIPSLLEQSRISVDFDLEEVISKDSRFVTDGDRETILEKCRECPESRIVITHGTTTMPETARYLGERNPRKTIVLVGSAVPGNKEKSDALFNLGSALMAVQLLPAGVYVIMNGRVFSWDNVKKNMNTGYFETVK